MDGGAWWATVHGVTKSWTRLSNFTFFSLSPREKSFNLSPSQWKTIYPYFTLSSVIHRAAVGMPSSRLPYPALTSHCGFDLISIREAMT